MFEDAPVKSKAQAVQALQERKIDLALFKKAHAAILGVAVSASKWTSILFPLQYVLPLLFVIPYALITKGYWCLFAILPYLAIPSLRPLNAPVAISTTAAGLFVFYMGWPDIIACLLVPACLSYAGEQLWWGVVQVTVLRRALRSESAFNHLWEEGALVINTKDKSYRHMTAASGRGSHDPAEEVR